LIVGTPSYSNGSANTGGRELARLVDHIAHSPRFSEQSNQLCDPRVEVDVRSTFLCISFAFGPFLLLSSLGVFPESTSSVPHSARYISLALHGWAQKYTPRIEWCIPSTLLIVHLATTNPGCKAGLCATPEVIRSRTILIHRHRLMYHPSTFPLIEYVVLRAKCLHPS